MRDSYYTGESGEDYLRQRHVYVQDDTQAVRAEQFSKYISETATVLDFGCGTGGVLRHLNCSRRIGVEISEHAAAMAARDGIEVYADVNDVPDGVADVVITYHALEHVTHPFGVLEACGRKLKEGGRIVVIVPAEQPRARRSVRWRANVERHLYCWTPLTLGNLLIDSGYRLEDARLVRAGHSRYLRWCRRWRGLYSLLAGWHARVRGRYHTVGVATWHPAAAR